MVFLNAPVAFARFSEDTPREFIPCPSRTRSFVESCAAPESLANSAAPFDTASVIDAISLPTLLVTPMSASIAAARAIWCNVAPPVVSIRVLVCPTRDNMFEANPEDAVMPKFKPPTKLFRLFVNPLVAVRASDAAAAVFVVNF